MTSIAHPAEGSRQESVLDTARLGLSTRPKAPRGGISIWCGQQRIVLEALTHALPQVPGFLAGREDPVEAVPLSGVSPDGQGPLNSRLVEALVGLLAQLVTVRKETLPALPGGWPRDGHSRTFLRMLALLADRDIRQSNWTEFGGLFAALGVPESAMRDFADRLPPMVRRPFSLLHADLGRDKVLLPYDGQPPLVCLDWELACYGDPLYDLATHLVRMRYPPEQHAEVKRSWLRAMNAVRPAAANGMETDLRHYLDFERAQTLWPEVMRAARSLGEGREPAGLERATAAVRRSLLAASQPLTLTKVPGPAEIERALYRWHAAWGGKEGEPRQLSTAYWVKDPEFRASADFPSGAVTEALAAEGAAASPYVFKGTGHLNTVVYVRSAQRSVVVRRKLESESRREACFLQEHVVLRALENADCGVRAPRVLALGESGLADGFAIHSYEGPSSGPPEHPVHGLRPAEADDLVDQLGAVADAGLSGLDPTMGPAGFYDWLSDRLVELVDSLPRPSLQLARALGLPDAARLKELLAGRTVTPRSSVLLHGDLNPWNLVRGETPGRLTLIDWEMAMVGDPLYDLVRHLHLTPHSAEIRQRMVQRWERVLGRRGDAYVDGWERDVHTYRWVELIRSAYVDLDRLLTGDGLDAPNVRRAVDSYAMTLQAATASLGLRGARVLNPYLELALPQSDRASAV
ncbi:phosphotransferase [Streptomyces sp. NPDC087440]|uniref:phosphotransferase n=1 Tax=Streptomyces sp. NPDC087440 TaxID=3365790 RepID=UPI00380B8DDD